MAWLLSLEQERRPWQTETPEAKVSARLPVERLLGDEPPEEPQEKPAVQAPALAEG